MSLWKDWKLHLTILVAVMIAEFIGVINISIGSLGITLLPLLYSMVIMAIIYLFKPIKFIGKKQAKIASPLLTLSVSLLMAKLGVASGESIEAVIEAGPVLLLQNLGNIGTLLIAMPIALLLGLKRESLGMTHSLGREANIGLISDVYGPDTAEFRGVMTSYIVGTLFGTILMSFIPSIFVNLGIFSPEAAAMAVGSGSASMMTAGLGAVAQVAPGADYTTLQAFASISNIISSAISVYLAIFITLPLGEWLLKVFKVKGESVDD